MSRSTFPVRPPSIHLLWAGLSVLLLARAAHVLQLDWPDFVTYLPDDAFYYFALGRNFAQLGNWSFDAGVSQASGFHLLQGYQSALIARWFPASLPGVSLAVSTAMGIGAAWLSLRAVQQLFGSWAAWAMLPVLVSYPFLSGAVSGMEWGYVVLFAALVYHQLAQVGSEAPSRSALLCLALAGLGLEWARSDAGLLAGALFVAAAWTALRQCNRPMLLATGAVLSGAVLGLATTLAHTWWLRGSLLTGSAEIKHLWAQRSGLLSGLRGGYRLFLQTLGFPKDSAGMLVLGLVALMVGYAVFLLYRSHRSAAGAADDADTQAALGATSSPPVRATLLTGSLLAAAGYLLMFCLNSAVLFWYAALITLPVMVVLGACVRAMQVQRRPWATQVLALGVGASVVVQLGGAWRPMEDHHRHMYAASRYISAMPAGTRVGVWNAGIIGYFSPPGRVVNLDGLVNDDAIPYIVGNTLPAYLQRTGIHHLADFSQMIEGRGSQHKGGYDTQGFRDSVQVLEVLSPVTQYIASDMRVYRLQPR